MNENYYQLIIDGRVIANGLELETALIFAKALMNEWWREPNLDITIRHKTTSETDEDDRGDWLMKEVDR